MSTRAPFVGALTMCVLTNRVEPVASRMATGAYRDGEKDPTMANLIDHYTQWLRVGGRSKTTIDSRERLLLHADKHLSHGVFRAIPDELADYLDQSSWSSWTLYTYDGYLRGYYDYLVKMHHLDESPMGYLLRPPEGNRLPNPCTDEEFAYLLTHAPEKPWRLAFLLAGYAGLRISELARLQRNHITEEQIRVFKGKGNKDAVIPTHPLIWEAVKDLPMGTRTTPGNVVRDPDGQPVTGYQLMNRGWYLYRSLNLPEMRMHRLRHWHATSLLRAGADLPTVQQCMRHASINSTVGYTLIDSERRQAAVHRLRAVVPGPAVTRPGDTTTEAA